MKPQRFEVLKIRAAIVHPGILPSTYAKAERISREINEDIVIQLDRDYWLEPFAVDEGNTPSIDELEPEMDEQMMLDEDWEWVDSEARRLVQ